MRYAELPFRPDNIRLIAFAVMLLGGVIPAKQGRAADPQPYTVTVKPTGNSALDSALTGSSTLISLRESAPVAGFALVQRALQDEQRFTTALQSYGYYKATIRVMIDNHPVDDPTLPTLIEDAPANPPVPVVVSFDLGPQFILGKVSIEGTVPPDVPGHLQIKTGDPAEAAPVLMAQGRLLDALKRDGYPLAKVPTPIAILHPDRNQLDVTFHPDAGPQADIGPITLTGLKDMHESFVRKRLLLHQGERYNPDTIEKARADLSSLGVFSVVRVETPDHLDPQGQIPVTFDFTERPLHAVDFGVSYSTDLGIGLSAGWHDRNLFGNGEQLNLTAMNQLGGNAVTKPGYQFGAQFLKPDFLARDQTLEVDLTAVKQSLQAYDQTALIEKLALNRKLSEHWTASLGILGEQESILQEDVRRTYNLVGLPATLRFDDTNSLLEPTRGIRAALSVTPMQSLGQPDATFFITQLTGSTYLDLSGNGRSVLALRGLVGKVLGAGVFSLPPDQRFYAGGSGTVRGYRYQTLGPQFPDGNPTGGTAISTGTVEFRQRFLESFGVVGFLDVGQVSASGSPFSSQWHAGAGVGARYYTSIGPIRLDVAVPLNKEPGGDSFELYIGIGEAF
ncbi:MAG TPA: autotransporter assembly complex family protein [Rhodopila sp.]|uniref:autotransporter assembly complex protein TamA n=1 Tax=Rhodopila sp. TaxID=2480087 RepID=UPI002C80188B|nr:autotransporter assembly complex family protein [Rhodopila sp.]HVY13749.1 autotransporter assembly complex family protein [Rhodopila sp.]